MLLAPPRRIGSRPDTCSASFFSVMFWGHQARARQGRKLCRGDCTPTRSWARSAARRARTRPRQCVHRAYARKRERRIQSPIPADRPRLRAATISHISASVVRQYVKFCCSARGLPARWHDRDYPDDGHRSNCPGARASKRTGAAGAGSSRRAPPLRTPIPYFRASGGNGDAPGSP